VLRGDQDALRSHLRGWALFKCERPGLLYKHHLDKDERDFEATLGRLSPAQQAWLRDGLELVHPGDLWLSRLEASTTDADRVDSSRSLTTVRPASSPRRP
jgi:hypothetical protein